MPLLKIIFGLAALSGFLSIVANKRYIYIITTLALFSALAIRSAEAMRLPGTGMLESLGFFAFCLAFFALISGPDKRESRPLLLFASFVSLALVWQQPKMYIIPYLAPALDSPLFILHVPLFFLGYAALTLETSRAIFGKMPDPKLAIFFIASGIVTGGIWGHLAWATAWAWDPKETWALVVLLFLFAAKHTEKPLFKKLLMIAAFIAMLITFLGVAFLFRTMHSYN